MPSSVHRRPVRWLAIAGLQSGLLTMLLGLGLALIGMGFLNATASGTGMGAFCVGLWTVLASRGLWRQRPITLAGLALAWLWLAGRIAWDWPATSMSAVVVLFLLPMVSVPLGAVWGLASAGFLGLLIAACVRSIRRRGSADAPVAPTSGGPDVSASAPPARVTRRQIIGLTLRCLCVVVTTLTIPHLIWLDREQKISDLAAEFVSEDGTKSQPVAWGACSSVFLGYELTQHGADKTKDTQQREANYERALSDALADLDSIRQAGARFVRAGASGDHLVEAHPDQERVDDRYIAAARQTGMDLLLVDTQHPKVLRNRRMNWADFCQFQRERIEYYQRRYEPEVYFVVCEPMSYHGFALTPETRYSVEAWAAQLSEMCRLVKSIRPATRTGICLLVMPEKEPEWEVWSRMKTLPELDILSVEIYAPENLHQTLERLEQYGHPREAGKAFWIAETYNGWALCGERRRDLDASWIHLMNGFARQAQAEVVLVWTFGSFVPGGSFRDFGSGRLNARWTDANRLSEVGQAFQNVATP